MPRNYSEEEIQEIVTAVESADKAFHAGDFGIAEEMYSQAMPILEQAIGKEDPSTLAVLQNLADCCFGLHSYDDAIGYYEKLIAASEHVFGHAHQNTVAALLKLAKVYTAAGRPKDSERAMQAASERSHIPVSDLLDTADRVINDVRIHETDRHAQRKQLEELQRSTQAFQQLRNIPNEPGSDEEVAGDGQMDQSISQRMHRPSAHRSQTADLRRAADIREEAPTPDNFLGLLKAKASIIVPIVGVILVIGLIVFIFLSLPSSAPPAADPTKTVKSVDEEAPVDKYFQTADSQEVLSIEGDTAHLTIGKGKTKCSVIHIGQNWTDIFEILVGSFTNHEIWFQETSDGLTRENGPKFYGKSSPENVVINKVNAVGRKAASWFMVARRYPNSDEELQSNEVMYINPISKVPTGPILQRFDCTEADLRSIIDGSQSQSLEDAFRHIHKSIFDRVDSSGFWKEEAKPKPCAVHCLSILLGADANHFMFFAHGFDRHGELLRASNPTDDVFLISLKDGVQTKWDLPTLLDKPPVRPYRIVLVKTPENIDLKFVHLVWLIIFSVLACLSVAAAGFEKTSEGERTVGVLPKGTAVFSVWFFVFLLLATIVSLIAP